MTHCKYYLISLLRQKNTFIIWMGIFAFITFLNSWQLDEQIEQQFEAVDLKIAINDSRAENYRALSDYLANKQSLDIIDLDETEAKELVYLGAYDIVFLEREGADKLEAFTNPSSEKSYMATAIAERFLDYLEITKEDKQLRPELAQQIADTEVKTEIFVANNNEQYSIANQWYYYTFRFLAYPLMSVVMAITALSSIGFMQGQSLVRIKISAMPRLKNLMHTFIAQLLGVVLILLASFMIILAIARFRVSENILWYLLNALTFATSSLGLLFLLFQINANRYFLLGLSNSMPLALAFLSGVFVPQEFLPNLALSIARFFPVFYYIRANKLAMDNFSQQYLFYLLIQLAFAICYFAIAALIASTKKSKTA